MFPEGAKISNTIDRFQTPLKAIAKTEAVDAVENAVGAMATKVKKVRLIPLDMAFQTKLSGFEVESGVNKRITEFQSLKVHKGIMEIRYNGNPPETFNLADLKDWNFADLTDHQRRILAHLEDVGVPKNLIDIDVVPVEIDPSKILKHIEDNIKSVVIEDLGNINETVRKISVKRGINSADAIAVDQLFDNITGVTKIGGSFCVRNPRMCTGLLGAAAVTGLGIGIDQATKPGLTINPSEPACAKEFQLCMSMCLPTANGAFQNRVTAARRMMDTYNCTFTNGVATDLMSPTGALEYQPFCSASAADCTIYCRDECLAVSSCDSELVSSPPSSITPSPSPGDGGDGAMATMGATVGTAEAEAAGWATGEAEKAGAAGWAAGAVAPKRAGVATAY